MTDAGETIDAADVQKRLPDGWRVENDSDLAVYGYADGHAPGTFPDPAALPASFGIRRESDLWTAIWLEPNEAHGGRHEPVDHVTGIKERCIEWVLEQATGLEEHAGV
jgi:hypothetical protein